MRSSARVCGMDLTSFLTSPLTSCGPAPRCAICLEAMVAGVNGVLCVRKCGHSFHSGCLKRWLHGKEAESVTCPMCKCNMAL